jgi:hypothetical protein
MSEFFLGLRSLMSEDFSGAGLKKKIGALSNSNTGSRTPSCLRPIESINVTTRGGVPYTMSELVAQAESKMKVQFFYELRVETPRVLRGIRFIFVPARTRKPLAKMWVAKRMWLSKR